MGPRVFVNAWIGAGNLGDELLFERLLEQLRANGVEHITSISLDPDDTASRHPDVDTVTPRQLLRSAAAIRRATAVIVGPGGILQDDTSPWSLPYQLHRPLLARVLRTPVIGHGLGAGPLRRRSSGWLLRQAFGGAAELVVRDEPSAKTLTALGVSATATADLVIGSPKPSVKPADRMVVSLRPHRPGGAIVPVRWQTDAVSNDRLTATALALDEAARRHDLTTTFVAFEPHRDHPLHQAVAARMATTAETIVPDTDTLLAEVTQSRVVVATRFHAGIAALVGNRPAVLVGYAPKVRSLAERLDGIFPIVPHTLDGIRQLPNEIDRALAVEPNRIDAAAARLRAIESRNTALLHDALNRC